MRNLISVGLVALTCTIVSGIRGNAPDQAKEPLRLVQTIPIPNVKGRIDHMDVDVKGKRLFVAGLENGTLEVVDLKAGQWMRSIPGFKAPQGIAYLPALTYPPQLLKSMKRLSIDPVLRLKAFFPHCF